MAATKSQLRRRIRAQRSARAHDPGEADALLAALRASGMLGRPGPSGPVVAAYVAAGWEPDPAVIRRAVRADGGRVLLPIPRAGRRLAWALDDGRYAPAASLPVPVPAGPPLGEGAGALVEAGVTLVLVPALAVDASGTRLGQGGGFYDTVLAELDARTGGGGGPGATTGPVTVLAVVHPDEVLAAGTIPREPHDVTLRAALTATGVVRLGAG